MAGTSCNPRDYYFRLLKLFILDMIGLLEIIGDHPRFGNGLYGTECRSLGIFGRKRLTYVKSRSYLIFDFIKIKVRNNVVSCLCVKRTILFNVIITMASLRKIKITFFFNKYLLLFIFN